MAQGLLREPLLYVLLTYFTPPFFYMRTIAYVDGFNLYYGSLKGTAYKWLDLKALLSSILGPSHNIIKIKYYTARISARPGNLHGPTEQDVYLRALQAYIPELEISYGHFLVSTVRMPLAKPHPWQKFCDVVKTEEKGSDVNLAVHLLNDAWQDKYDYGVVVSNDSDLAESLRLVKKHHGKKIMVLVPGDPKKRPPAIQLKRFAHKTQSIPLAAIAASQLPNPIPGTTIRKPKAW